MPVPNTVRPRGERKPMWEIRQAANAEALDMYIYDDVEGDGYDWWSGDKIESETSANHFRDVLGQYPDVDTINIYINSRGGSVWEGTSIYNQLMRHPARKVVRIDGFACSIASVIAMAGDEVIMPSNTLMFVHDMWAYTAGNAKQLRKEADDLDVINAAGRSAYLQKSNGKLDEATLAQMMEAETWLTADDCVRYGLADRAADEDADPEKIVSGIEQSIDRMQRAIGRHKEIAAALYDSGEKLVDVFADDADVSADVDPGLEATPTEQRTSQPVGSEPNKPNQAAKLLAAIFMHKSNDKE